MRTLIFTSLMLCLAACSTETKRHAFIGADHATLDSIQQASDSVYSKPYKARDFTTAEYFLNSKDSIITQIMRDSSDTIRQVIITRNNRRTFLAQYYPNGQLMVQYAMDDFGQYEGETNEYYENGAVKSSGSYHGGLRTGNWKMYDENGVYNETIIYNENGQQENVIVEKLNN